MEDLPWNLSQYTVNVFGNTTNLRRYDPLFIQMFQQRRKNV